MSILTSVLPARTGTIGHVAHGKSTVVKAISGVMTVRFKNELVRNITIKLGYANAKVRPPFFFPDLLCTFVRGVDLHHFMPSSDL